mmetsp:Transcript_12042/g.16067  ORF Transcript_12042/g.16067 Transcript_12042/m.16067 type:complete len:103 (+) Transcript_12042:1902-2210(+)
MCIFEKKSQGKRMRSQFRQGLFCSRFSIVDIAVNIMRRYPPFALLLHSSISAAYAAYNSCFATEQHCHSLCLLCSLRCLHTSMLLQCIFTEETLRVLCHDLI